MTWTMIIVVLWGDVSTMHIVEPFQRAEECTAAAEKLTADFHKAADPRFFSMVASCVAK